MMMKAFINGVAVAASALLLSNACDVLGVTDFRGLDFEILVTPINDT
jgi:hypothetical protein